MSNYRNFPGPRTAQRYSYLAKKLQVAALVLWVIIMIIAAIKAHAHVELHMHKDAEMMYNELMEKERDRMKIEDRLYFPDRTKEEREYVDKEIEKGTINGTAMRSQ